MIMFFIFYLLIIYVCEKCFHTSYKTIDFAELQIIYIWSSQMFVMVIFWGGAFC
jgi:hypothetical protein